MEEPSELEDWRKISVLGSGGFGTVSLWKNRKTSEYIAIKKCKFQKVDSVTPKQRERWNNEVQIMKLINHPNVINFKPIPNDFHMALLRYNSSKLPLLSMEYCTKGSLRHILREPKNICGLQEQHVRCVLEDISCGLNYLHTLNITHRDIKPDNIVLQHCEERHGNIIYKIIDLGYAKEIGDTVVSFVGTLHYIAPEIFLVQQYNNSVDYWSLGILAFEIICGVLPFLPDLGPYERFKKIKEKGPDDICIYFSHAGSVTYSTELKKENHVSYCFKQNIETWLRHVLQFDPCKRAEHFPNGANIFEYLNEALNKKIVNVFSVYKLEFYSYEINDSTLLRTLKDWISRDIKVLRSDLILFFNDILQNDDNALVASLLEHSSSIFVFKKGLFVSDAIIYNFPKLLRELFNKSQLNLNNHLLRQLYGQTIFYITCEIRCLRSLTASFCSYFSYTDNLCNIVNERYNIICKDIENLISNIETFNNVTKNNVCDINLASNIEYRDCVCYLQRLLASLERSEDRRQLLSKKIKKLGDKQNFLTSLFLEIKALVQGCDIQEQLTKAVGLVTSNAGQDKNLNFINSIKTIVSDTIKAKDKLLTNKDFKNYSRSMAQVFNAACLLHTWMQAFENHIHELTKAFSQSEAHFHKIVFEATQNQVQAKPVPALNGEIISTCRSVLIQENVILRHKFDEILHNSIFAHSKYKEETASILF